MKRLRLAILAFAFFLPLLAAGSMARANCANPTNVAGQEIYNTTYHVKQYCNGTTWKAEGLAQTFDSGLVGYWKLDESSGNAADSSGNGYTMTLTGSGTWLPSGGRIGGGIDLGVGGKLQTTEPNAAIDSINDTITVAFWIKDNGSAGNYDNFVGKDNGTGWSVNRNATNSDAYTIIDTSGGSNQTTLGNYPVILDGTWHHVALTLNSGAGVEYVDGSVVNSGSYNHGTGFGQSTSGPAIRGPTTSGDYQYDDVRIYNRVLSAAEISALYNYRPSGYFVMSKTTWNGNLGGSLAAADAKCLTDLTTNTGWQGYATANASGLLVSGNVHAFLAYDASTANVLKPQTRYIFANANDATAGGASFTTDGNGDGPNDSADWSGLTYFNGDFNYWSNRDTNSPTSWKDHIQSTGTCLTTTPWDTGTNAQNGVIADSANGTANRWETFNTLACNTLEHLVCYVNSTEGACSNPAGAEGDEIYNTTYHAYQFCNGTNWIAEGLFSTFDKGLVGWWKLDESSGTDASDSTGNGRDGTLYNSPVWQPSGGKINGALSLTGTNDYVGSGNYFSDIATTNQPYSFSFWINPAAAVTDGQIVHVSQNADGTGWCVGFVALTGGKIVASSWNGATNTVTSNATITPGQWYHVVNTWDPTNGLQVYINGSYDNSVADPTYSASNSGADYVFLGFGYGLGCVGDVAAHFTGLIDDFRVYNRALSAAEISALYNSAPTVTWTQQTGSGSRAWNGVASSSDGTHLVAVDNSPGYIYTSTDSGVTWTQQTGSGSRAWYGVASSSDGTHLVAVVYNGQIYTSTDSGVTWTAQASSLAWTFVASSSDGTHLAAAVHNGQIYTSTDSGVTWTAQASGSRTWEGLASSSDGTKLVAVNGAPGYIYTSTDSGVTWTQRTGSGSRYWYGVASSSDGTHLVAADQTPGYIYTSTDSGVTWTQQTGSGTNSWWAVASSSDGTHLVAIVSGGSGQIYTSTDSGVTWTAQTGAGSRNWYGVASSSDGAKLAAAVQLGYIWTNATSGGGTCANPTDVEKKKMYNTTSNVMQFCNGTNWIKIGP